MSIKSIFAHFDEKERLWISVNEVKRQIMEQGCPDEIEFHFVDIDEAKVRGFLVRTGNAGGPYENYLDNNYKSDIYIARSLDEEWRRVVAVKELLHIIDNEKFSAESREAVDSLLENMALPSEVREYRASYLNDRLRLISAISILVPRKCRETLRDLQENRRITPSEMAMMAKIPVRFADFVLDPVFEKTLETIHQPDT